MKKILFFVLTALTFAACEQALVEEQSAICPDVPETITVGFEGEDSRIQLNEAQKTVWTSGDLVSVFYRSDANQKWQYTGDTGARTADLTCVDAGEATATMNRVVVVYPYSENYYINTETYNVQATLPAVQNYLKDSYGLNGNIMISSSEYNNFSLKTVYGWLKLQLTGNGEQVKSITVRGNNGEQVAGEAYINTTDATMTLAADKLTTDDDSEAGGSLIFEDTILTEVTLDCGEGVALGKEATAFYIALPPQTFEKGFTVDIECDNYKPMTLSTTNTLTIERNHIQPMASVEHDASPIVPNNQIWYTSSDGNIVTPDASKDIYGNTVFGANIVSNEYKDGIGVITFDNDVTKIGQEAFYGCENLTSVTIPDSVTEIGDSAFFNCGSLTSVIIPDSVTKIGSSAFSFCSSLTSVIIPDSVTKIGGSAFSNCRSLISVIISGRVTMIREYTFSGCDSLTSVYCKATTPPSLDGTWVFDYNGSGRKIYVPAGSVKAYKSATNWSEYASAIVGYYFYNKIWYTSSDGNVVKPNRTDVFGANIVSNEYNNGMGIITFDGDVTTIGEDAFRNCTSLTSVTIPDSVPSIGNYAFRGCSSLTGVTFGRVSTIGEFAFSDCTSLTSVTIGRRVSTIGIYAFRNCTSLTSVIIPDSVKIIGGGAFRGCSSLTSVTIPSWVTSIEIYAFYDCISLASVYCKATTPPKGGSGMFGYNAPGRKIYVPTNCVNEYKRATFWKDYTYSIVGYDF